MTAYIHIIIPMFIKHKNSYVTIIPEYYILKLKNLSVTLKHTNDKSGKSLHFKGILGNLRNGICERFFAI